MEASHLFGDLQKQKNFRNNSYMNFVRAKPCCVCGTTHEIHAHHVRLRQGGGTGLKPSDYRVVPLCATHHGSLHNIGEGTFWRKSQKEPLEIIQRLLIEYAGPEGFSVEEMEFALESRRKSG